MDIKGLEMRMYFLAGQLEEAKKFYKEAMVEIEKSTKEQDKETVTANSGETVSVGN